MLIGCYFNTIDSKGRVFIPTKLRYSLGERICLIKGVDGCINIFTQEAWTDYAGKYIINRTYKDEKARQLRRFILGGSRELEIDKQGRINLPQDLIEYAKIEKDVVFVGVGDLIELWGAEAYEKEMGPDNLNPKEIMANAAVSEAEV